MGASRVKDIKATSSNFDFIIQELRKQDFTKPQRLSLRSWDSKRSIPANKAYQGWYPAMSDALAMSNIECTCFVKLNFGLPILLSNDYFNDLIGDSLRAKGFFELSYKDKLPYMIELPVTRLFDTKMHNRLRDDLQNYFGNMGYDLDYKG